VQEAAASDELAVARWQPVFNVPLPLAAVAADARDTATQVEHFAALAHAMHAHDREISQVVEALQLCERTHGYGAVALALNVITAAVESGISLTGLSLTTLARQRGCAGSGVLVGALVEDCAKVHDEKRRFPVGGGDVHSGSPHVEFEDCIAGAQIASTLGQIGQVNQPDFTTARPFSALASAFRRHGGVRGLDCLKCLADEAMRHAAPTSAPLTIFIRLVAQTASDHINLPAQWQRYARQQAAGHSAR
jgi:hypothetical protein